MNNINNKQNNNGIFNQAKNDNNMNNNQFG